MDLTNLCLEYRRTVSTLWRRHWLRMTPLFAFPAEVRKVIHTTNEVESLNATLRKMIKTRLASERRIRY
jgi:transposase-like protein